MKVSLSKIHIVISNILIWLLFLSIFLFHFPNHTKNELILLFIIAVVFYYLNSLIFIPKYLWKEKFAKYFFSIFISLVIAITITIAVNKYQSIYKSDSRLVQIKRIEMEIESFPNETINKKELLQKIKEANDFNRLPIPMRTLIFIVLIFGISTSIKVTQEWFKKEKLIKEAENTKLNAELTFLKSQVNPHFLFNTLNSIYSLANRRSEKAADAIAKLSNILRYMLYNTDTEYVALEDEIQYLVDYVELQKLRLNDNIQVDFNINGNPRSYTIAPMLLLPFVENAFKHGTNTVNSSIINVNLSINQNELFFEVSNTYLKGKTHQQKKYSGIGLQNVKRRLELIYPKTHNLLVEQSNDKFFINLYLILTGNELLNS